MPSKALLHASEMYESAIKDFAGLGIDATAKVNLPVMMQQKADSVGQLTKGIEFLFKKNKAEWIKGFARLAGDGKVVVKAEDGSERTLTAKNIVIATGSEPSGLPGVTVDQKRIVDSTGALSLPEIPKSLIVIGAGIIGLELGSVWRRLGARGDGGGIPRPHLPRHGRGHRQDLPALPHQTGHGVQPRRQGHRRNGLRQGGRADL